MKCLQKVLPQLYFLKKRICAAHSPAFPNAASTIDKQGVIKEVWGGQLINLSNSLCIQSRTCMESCVIKGDAIRYAQDELLSRP